MLTRHNSESTVHLLEHVVTKTWLRTVLRECYSHRTPHPAVRVNSFALAEGPESSETVLSDIIALSVEADVNEERITHDFVIKLLPLDPYSRYFVKEAEFDLREVKFYTQLVPDLEDFQRRRLAPDPPCIDLPIPKCYLAKYVPIEGHETPPSTPHEINESIIVLEDLKKRGFRNIAFREGLTLGEVKSALSSVSRLHALSLAYKVEQNRPLDVKYDFLFQSEKASVSYQHLMERGLPQLINFLEDRGGMAPVIECLNVIRAKAKHLTQVLLSPREPLSLITHTDFWSNNLLFKDNQCLIIDWQMVTYSHPTNDLALLIISSLPPKVRRKHSPSLLDHYWRDLLEHCQSLSLDVEAKLCYGREDLAADYSRSQLLALLLCIGSIDVAFRDSEIERRLMAVLTDLHADGVLSVDFVNQL